MTVVWTVPAKKAGKWYRGVLEAACDGGPWLSGKRMKRMRVESAMHPLRVVPKGVGMGGATVVRKSRLTKARRRQQTYKVPGRLVGRTCLGYSYRAAYFCGRFECDSVVFAFLSYPLSLLFLRYERSPALAWWVASLALFFLSFVLFSFCLRLFFLRLLYSQAGTTAMLATSARFRFCLSLFSLLAFDFCPSVFSIKFFFVCSSYVPGT